MHPDVITSVWDDPRNVDTLTRLWAEGKSATEIAFALGQNVTRNAVIGKAVRLKLPKKGRPSGGGRGNPGQPNVNGIIKRQASRGAQGLAFKITEARKQGLTTAEAMPLVLGKKPFREGAAIDMDEAGVDVTGLVGIMDLNAHTCRWPHGDPLLPGFGFCGKPPLEGKPYCEEHDRRAHTHAAD